jgi:selenide,water dikinase
MDQFAKLPEMASPTLPAVHALGVKEALGDKPMCGGCGAKVGRAALRGVLADLPKSERDDVQMIEGDDAGLSVIGETKQVMSTDHLRGFTNDPYMMTKIAAVHALGDIWAMGAKPQAVSVSVILPRMSADLQRRTMAEIMAAAHEVIAGAGGAIVGGHSSLGDEFTIGFTATGLCEIDPITLSGAQVGDAIILTQPVGSGVIMAAEMAGMAHGVDVLAALESMTQGQAEASNILSNAHAMTDVTGFGIAGHLDGICGSSGVGAELTLSAIPIMSGAQMLSRRGIRSSLYADNVASSGLFSGLAAPDTELLFDPQTAGGLLATVEAEDADAILKALHNAGYSDAAIIGEVTSSSVKVS